MMVVYNINRYSSIQLISLAPHDPQRDLEIVIGTEGVFGFKMMNYVALKMMDFVVVEMINYVTLKLMDSLVPGS